ncbi:MAG: GNAT family protein [Pseudomonadota bacterium]
MHILSNDVFVVRPLFTADADALLAAVLASHAEISAWESWCVPDYGKQHAVDFLKVCEQGWQQGSEFSCGIFSQADASLMGTVALNHIRKMYNMANLGYWIRSDSTGSGIATRAALALATFGLGQIGLGRIEIVVRHDNLASRRVAEKLGARAEGLARNRLLLHGEPKDAMMYSLIPADLR